MAPPAMVGKEGTAEVWQPCSRWHTSAYTQQEQQRASLNDATQNSQGSTACCIVNQTRDNSGWVQATVVPHLPPKTNMFIPRSAVLRHLWQKRCQHSWEPVMQVPLTCRSPARATRPRPHRQCKTGTQAPWVVLLKLTPFLAVYLIFLTFLMPFLCCLYVWLCAAGGDSSVRCTTCLA